MADRFFITAQMKLIPPSNLKQVARDIKTAFKTISTVETKIKLPSNLAAFKRKLKSDIQSLSGLELKLIYPQNMTKVKQNINKKLKDAADVPIKLHISKSAEATIARLHAKIKKAGTVNVNVNLPKGINSTLRLLLQLKSKNINVNVGNTNSATKALQSTAKAAQTAASEVERFGAQSAAAIRRYAALTLVASGFYSLFDAFRKSVSGAIEFEKEIIKIRQVTGLAVQDLSGLSSEVTRLSTSLGVSSQKLLNVAQILAQAGYNAEDTKIALETLAKTELSATFEDIESTTEGAIALMAQFGKGVRDLDKDMSAINTVSAKFAVESSDIITALRRTGGAFQAAGGSLEELLGLFTSVRATTRESAESISTGLRTIFTRLQRTRTQNFLQSLGLDLKDDKGLFVGPFKAIQRLSKALNEISNQDPRFAQILEELGGFRQIGKSIPLIKQFNLAMAARDVALRSGNSLTEDAIKAQDSFSNKLTKLKERFDAVIRSLVSSDTFKDTTDFMLKMANSAIQLTGALTKLLPAIRLFALAGGSVLATQYFSGFLGKGQGNTVNYGGLASGAAKNKKFANSVGGSQLSNAYAFTAGEGGLLGNSSLTRGLTLTGLLGGPGAAIISDMFKKPGEESNKFVDAIGNVTTQTALLALGFVKLNRFLTQTNTSRLVAGVQVIRQQKAVPALAALNAAVGPQKSFARTKYLSAIGEMKAQLASARASEKFGATLDKYVVGATLAAAITSQLAESYEEAAEAQLKLQKYTEYQRNKSISGALTGGNNAILLGGALALVIAPFNAAAAAVVAGITTIIGAMWGWSEASARAAEEVRMSKFKTDFDKELGYLQKVRANEVDPTLGVGRVERKFTGFRDKLYGAQSDREKESIRGSIEASLVDLGNFLSTIAMGKKTFEELDKELHNAIEIYAEFSGQTLAEYKKSIEGIMEEIKKEEDQVKNLREAHAKEARAVRELESLIYGITNLRDKVDNFADTLEQFDGLASGNASGFKFKIDSSVFDNLKNSDNKRFNSVTRGIGSFFGETGTRIASEIQSVPDIVNALPSILTKVANQPAFSDSGEFVDRFKDEIKGLPKSIQKILISQVNKLIGRESKPDKLLDDIKADVYGVAEQITKGLEQLINPFKEAAPIFENLLNGLSQGLAKYRDLTFEIVDKQNAVLQSQVALTNRGIEFDRGSFRTQFENQLGGNRQALNNLLGSRAGASAQSLGNDAIGLRRQIAEIDDKLRQSPSFDEADALVRQRESLAEELGMVTKGLEMLGDSARDAAVLEEMYNRVREENQPRRDLIKAYTFGTQNDRRDINTTIAAVARLVQTKDIETIPEALRAGVLSMLESFGEAKIFGVNARELSEETQVNYLKRLGLSEDDARANVQKTQEEAQLQQRILQAYQDNITAQQVSTNLLVTSQKDLQTAIYDWIAAVRKQAEIDILLKQRQIQETEKRGLESNISGLSGRQKQIEALGQKLGIDLTKPDNIKYLQSALNEATEIDKLNKQAGAVGNAKTVKTYDGMNKEQIVRGLRQETNGGFTTQELERIYQAGEATKTTHSGLSPLQARQKELEKIRKEKLTEINKERNLLIDNLGAQFNQEQITNIVTSLKELNAAFTGDGILTNLTSFKELTDKMTEYVRQLEEVKKSIDALDVDIKGKQSSGPTQGKARGGQIRGVGFGDTVPAMLTPGEYVLNKKLVNQIGVDKLNDLNFGGVQKFKKGGAVKRSKDFYKADEIFQKTFGFSINDLVGGRITEPEYHPDLSSGSYHTGDKSIYVKHHPVKPDKKYVKIDRARSFIHEAIHSLDKNLGLTRANKVGKSYGLGLLGERLGDKLNIFKPIFDAFSTNGGSADLDKLQKLKNLVHPGDLPLTAASQQYRAYFSHRREITANTLSALLYDGKKGFEQVGLADEYEVVSKQFSKLQKFLGTQKGIDSVFGAEHANEAFKPKLKAKTVKAPKNFYPVPIGPETPPQYPKPIGPKPKGKNPYPRAPKNAYPTPIGPKSPYDVRGTGRYIKPRLGARKPTTTITTPRLFGRLVGRLGQATGVNKIPGILGKELSVGKLGGFGGVADKTISGLGGFSGKSLTTGLGVIGNVAIAANSVKEASEGKTLKATSDLALGLSTPTFFGNIAGNVLNNLGSYLGTGAEPVSIFDNSIGNLIQETGDLQQREGKRGAYLNDKVFERQAKIERMERENTPEALERKATSERIRKNYDEFIKERNAKQAASDAAAQTESAAAKELREKYGYVPGQYDKEIEKFKKSFTESTGIPTAKGNNDNTRAEIAGHSAARDLAAKAHENAGNKYGHSKIEEIQEQEYEKKRERDLANDRAKENYEPVISLEERRRRVKERMELEEKGFGFATGGPVHGSGVGDTVPAMLTPGEYVLNKRAVRRLGINTLDKLNSGVHKFASGGAVMDDEQVQIEIERRDRERKKRIKQNKKDVEEYRKKNAEERKKNQAENKKLVDEYREQQKIERAKNGAENKKIIRAEEGKRVARSTRGQAPRTPISVIGKSGTPKPSTKVPQTVVVPRHQQVFPSVRPSGGHDIAPPSNKPHPPMAFGSDEHQAYSDAMSQYDKDKQKYDTMRLFGWGLGDTEDKYFGEEKKKLEKQYGFGGKTQNGQQPKQGPGDSKGSGGPCPCDMEMFKSSVNIFNTAVADLGKVLNAFPHTISLEANHKVEVIFNGAEVLQGLLPSIQEIALGKAQEVLNQYTQKNNMPTPDNTVKSGGQKGNTNNPGKAK